MKNCNECGVSKELTEYYKGRNVCKICCIERGKANYHYNMAHFGPQLRKKRAEQREQHREKITAYNRQWYERNREHVRAYRREWMRKRRAAQQREAGE